MYLYMPDFQSSYIFLFRTLHIIIFKEDNQLIFDKFDNKRPFLHIAAHITTRSTTINNSDVSPFVRDIKSSGRGKCLD